MSFGRCAHIVSLLYVCAAKARVSSVREYLYRYIMSSRCAAGHRLYIYTCGHHCFDSCSCLGRSRHLVFTVFLVRRGAFCYTIPEHGGQRKYASPFSYTAICFEFAARPVAVVHVYGYGELGCRPEGRGFDPRCSCRISMQVMELPLIRSVLQRAPLFANSENWFHNPCDFTFLSLSSC